MLDLVHPIGPGGRLCGQGQDAGCDKSVSPNEESSLAGEIAAMLLTGGVVTLPRNAGTERVHDGERAA
jgi:hypothetical protein